MKIPRSDDAQVDALARLASMREPDEYSIWVSKILKPSIDHIEIAMTEAEHDWVQIYYISDETTRASRVHDSRHEHLPIAPCVDRVQTMCG
ncbi:hypothetical protein GW17_00024714 [Ensete ventricosum]|nr:hypothetical protein GW17_00024714 [Ensete ventricosum]